MHVITENEARNLARRIERGGALNIPADTILTPMARDYLRGRGIEVLESSAAGGRTRDRKSSAASGDDALVEAVAQEVSRVLGGKAARGKALSAHAEGTAAHAEGAASAPVPPVGAAQSKPPQRAVVWAIGGDRPGILAGVAELLKGRQINILEISQTILSGVFAMVVIIDITSVVGQFSELKAELEALGQKLGINLSAQRDDLFQFMHRV